MLNALGKRVTKATISLWDAEFKEGDYPVFGCESRGLPEAMVREAGDHGIRIPMAGAGTRRLNLSTGVGITLYESLRQAGGGDLR